MAMQMVVVNGASYAYEEQGAGPEALVMGHGFLFDHHAFDAQVSALSANYRCVTFDWRGQGASEVTQSGYNVGTLTTDAIELIERLDLAPCHFAGTSMGGWVGLRIALRRPDLVRSLILLNTFSEREGPSKVPGYLVMSAVARVAGMGPLVNTAMKTLFAPSFMSDPGRASDRERWRTHIAAVDRVGAFRTLYGSVLRAGSVTEQLGRVRTPVLVVAGAEDRSFGPARVQTMVERLPDAELHVLAETGHAAAIERPDEVTRLIWDFLQRRQRGGGTSGPLDQDRPGPTPGSAARRSRSR
jgi:pimeloyl-ACP methyl ester carboxylesterase